MVKRLRRIAAILRERHPDSVLKPLNAQQVARLKKQFPDIPNHLVQFFQEVGCGCIGKSRYMIYDLLSPDGIFDKATAADLDGIFLIGDDFAGTHEAYDTKAGWKFGTVGGNGRFDPHILYGTFIDFIEDWYVSEK
jgi:hypothetical protein